MEIKIEYVGSVIPDHCTKFDLTLYSQLCEQEMTALFQLPGRDSPPCHSGSQSDWQYKIYHIYLITYSVPTPDHKHVGELHITVSVILAKLRNCNAHICVLFKKPSLILCHLHIL